MIVGRLLTRNGQRLYLEELGSSVTMKDTLFIMGPLSRPHSKILRVSEENLFYAAKRLKYSLSGTSYPSAS